MRYSIIDVETTGGKPDKDRITEIAIFIFDGEKVIDTFQTLVNPLQPIQPFVIKLTGITNEMVAKAPTFPEIARRIVEITRNTVFVAHNVGFDYLRIKNEFKSLGFNYNRKRLCTVNLSRKILPNQSSYSLGKLTKSLGISLNGHHRAAADAKATVELFKVLLKEDKLGMITYKKNALEDQTQVPLEVLLSIPAEVGVYYFYNAKGDVIYIGKSKNMHDRVFSHLINVKSKKAIQMSSEVINISFQLTGSDLMAQIIEAIEIKKVLPKFNVAQRRSKLIYGLYSFKNESSYIELRLKKINKLNYHLAFSTEKEGRSYLKKKVSMFDLCLCLCGINLKSSSCLTQQLGLCRGASIEKESSDEYNRRVENILVSTAYGESDFLLPLKGRSDDEIGAVVVKDGQFLGYGFFKTSFDLQSKETFTFLENFVETRDIKTIIKAYLRGKVEKIYPRTDD